MTTLADLSPALQAEARRLLALPTGTHAEADASLRRWHAFVERHDIEHVSAFTDDFGSMFLRDQHGEVTAAMEHMPRA